MEPGPAFAEILAAARAGEDWAVTLIYRDLHPALARYLRAQEPRMAEDLESETWLAVAQRLHAFEGDEAGLRAWAFSIARRRLADHRRTAARRRTDPAPVHLLDQVELVGPESLVLDGLAGDEAAAFVVRSLPADQADVVLLRVIAGLDVAEVAEILGKKPGTVRVLQHRALRALKQKLTGKRVTQ